LLFVPAGKPTTLPFEKTDAACTTCRTHLSAPERSGYTNKSQSNLGITFNDLHEYVAGLKRAIKTPSEEYEKSASKKTVAPANQQQCPAD
jgi:glutamate--cysteine ligase